MMALSLSCGITIKDWDDLTLGQIAEVIIQKTKLEEEIYGEQDDKPKVRKATQADWDRLGAM